VAFGRDRDRLGYFTQLINDWIASGQYGLIAEKNGVVLLQRNTPSDPQSLQNWQMFQTPGETSTDGMQRNPSSSA
jgi:hypothetical protein